MKTLITAGTTSAAFAVGRIAGEGAPLVFGDNDDFPVPAFMPAKFIRISNTSSGTFIHDLLTQCLDLDVTCIFPLRKLEIIALATAKPLFLEFGIRIATPSPIEPALFNYTGKRKTIVIIQDGELSGALNEQPPAGPLPGDGIWHYTEENGYSIFTAD